MSKSCFIISLCLLLFFIGCQKAPEQFSVTIDWVPSPEYYGFFYAKEKGFYKEVGLDVSIKYGSGAPVVANQIATGAIYAGTTTSDNVLRQVARGGDFSRVIPLLKFNPVVLASLPAAKSPIREDHLKDDLRGKVLGTNKQSSVYQQLLYLVEKGYIQKGSFKEYPIGYGGALQLKQKLVDAILAYTTNIVVDLELENLRPNEIFFKKWIKTYGLVLVIGSEEQLKRSDLTSDDIQKFIKATEKGYTEGGKKENIQATVQALRNAEPTLNPRKIELAIAKITKLNEEGGYNPVLVDNWVQEKNITKIARERVVELLKRQ